MFTHHVTWIEAIGYIAAVCTLATYSMKTMIPLRTAGMTANVLFIAYGYFGAIYPTLVLHLILLALNATRLHQMLALVKKVREATHGDLAMDWLKSFMTPRRYRAGDVLLRQGDKADGIFFAVSGRARACARSSRTFPRGRYSASSGCCRTSAPSLASALRTASCSPSATRVSSSSISRTRRSASISFAW